MADIPEPLSRWQAYRIDKPDSVYEFCNKLLETYDIKFDEVLFKNYSQQFLSATQSTKVTTAN